MADQLMRKKILYVHHTGANGGATMSLFYLLEFAKKRHDVIVYMIADGPAAHFYRENGIRVVVDKRLSKYPHCTIEYQVKNPLRGKFYRDLRDYGRHLLRFSGGYAAMRQVLEMERPDIVHLNSTVLLAEGLAARSLGVPVVWHLRDFLEYGTFRVRHHIVSQIINRCSSCIVALCESEARRVGISENTHVIPNFVNLAKFNPGQVSSVGLRARYGWGDDVSVMAMLGWNNPSKGSEVAVEAMSKVLVRHPNVRLLLFGTGLPPEGASMRGFGLYRTIVRQLKRLRIEHAVKFAGTVFNVADYISEVDVVMAPFTVPHFARPILEAGAMRKVVVTSDLDGTREMVLNGRAGYLARPGDADDLADKLIQALENNNSERIERMYQNVLENYNAARNAERTLALYDDL